MPAISRDECFSAQSNIERVQVFGELSAIDRMELIDSNRYGFIPGKIAFDDAGDNALQWVGAFMAFFLESGYLSSKTLCQSYSLHRIVLISSVYFIPISRIYNHVTAG